MSMFSKPLSKYWRRKRGARKVSCVDQFSYDFDNVGIGLNHRWTHLHMWCEFSVAPTIPIGQHPPNCCLPTSAIATCLRSVKCSCCSVPCRSLEKYSCALIIMHFSLSVNGLLTRSNAAIL